MLVRPDLTELFSCLFYVAASRLNSPRLLRRNLLNHRPRRVSSAPYFDLSHSLRSPAAISAARLFVGSLRSKGLSIRRRLPKSFAHNRSPARDTNLTKA